MDNNKDINEKLDTFDENDILNEKNVDLVLDEEPVEVLETSVVDDSNNSTVVDVVEDMESENIIDENNGEIVEEDVCASTDIADEPEVIRERAIANLKEAENVMLHELKTEQQKRYENKKELTPLPPKEENRSNFGIGCFLLALVALFVALYSNSSAIKTINNLQSELNYLRMEVAEKHAVPETKAILTGSEIYNQNVESVVEIKVDIVEPSIYGELEGYGSGVGFVVESNGYILTNYHIVENATNISVVLLNGNEYTAEMVGYSVSHDLAVLKIDVVGLNPVTIGSSKNLSIGETVYTIGHPLSLPYSISDGIVGFNERIVPDGNGNPIYVIQLDSSLNNGNSGGPVFNQYGEVIGVANAKFAGGTIESVSFAVPIDRVIKAYQDIMIYGEVMDKPVLGIQVVTIDETTADMFLMEQGAFVREIDSGSAAEKAGLLVGDIIVEAEGKTIKESYDLLSLLLDYKTGDNFKLTVIRNGEKVEISLVLGFKSQLESVEENYIAEPESQLEGEIKPEIEEPEKIDENENKDDVNFKPAPRH